MSAFLLYSGPLVALDERYARPGRLDPAVRSLALDYANAGAEAQDFARSTVGVAIQEADGPSSWSGGFDHVSYLAERGAMPLRSRASSVDGLGLSYGTALLATAQLEDVFAVAFDPSPPTLSKGFLAATLAVEDGGGRKREIDFVSVHLDYSRTSVRSAQVADLVRHVTSRDRRDRAVVILVDFNCDWAEGSPLRELADRLDLRTYGPEAPLVTVPRFGSRIDWILVSKGLRIVSFEILPDSVSDHRAVVAELAFEFGNRPSMDSVDKTTPPVASTDRRTRP